MTQIITEMRTQLSYEETLALRAPLIIIPSSAASVDTTSAGYLIRL